MAKTTKEVADALGMKSREVTTYAKKYGLLPSETFGGMPMWEDADVELIKGHMAEMDGGERCPTCGNYLDADDTPADVLASDEPADAE